MNFYREMKAARESVADLSEMSREKPSSGQAVYHFLTRAAASARLVFEEKEIITFALLQWACIAAGYYLWVQVIDWIPPEVWERADKRKDVGGADVVMILWSFICVGLTAFPLGLLTGCMGAAHFLRRQRKESTIAGCLKMVVPRAWPLWMFHWIDGWWTMLQIVERLPSKNNDTTPAERALSEAMYYAWKVATIAITPALITGRGLGDAARGSVGLVRERFWDVAILRGGYSALCWLVGIATYVGTIFFFIKFPTLVGFGHGAAVGVWIYEFYFWAGVPILVSVGVIMLFLRPIYILSACELYADYVKGKNENLMLPEPPVNAGTGAWVIATLLAGFVLGVVIFMALQAKLGLPDWIFR